MTLALLALTSVLQLPAEWLTRYIQNGMNSTVVSEVVIYRGETVRFNHLFWRVDSRSVCFDQQQRTSDYSRCTQNAKALFDELCQQVEEQRHKNMFCQAAASYRPVVAQISDYGAGQVATLKRQCGDLRVQAMADKSKVAERNRVCGQYQALLDGVAPSP
ncbi:hypothetical protein [Gallaecimonas pentaromativorans]|uniref:hypothetical protein n=1 Tax=Gallaecimonas pentaromativorans TaxID=584787 RepID=UPI003A946F6F